MKKVLLWITVIPSAILAAILVGFLLSNVLRFWVADVFDWQWFKNINGYIIASFQSFWEPFTFIGTAIFIAPTFKREVGVFTIASLIIIGIGLIVFSLVTKYSFTFKDYIFYISHFFGCLFAFILLPNNNDTLAPLAPKKKPMMPYDDDIPALEYLSDAQYEKIKFMYGSTISREHALEIANSIEFLKRDLEEMD